MGKHAFSKDDPIPMGAWTIVRVIGPKEGAPTCLVLRCACGATHEVAQGSFRSQRRRGAMEACLRCLDPGRFVCDGWTLVEGAGWVCACGCGETLTERPSVSKGRPARLCAVRREREHRERIAARRAARMADGVPASYLARVRCSAKKREIPVLVTHEDLIRQWTAQDGQCAYTGIPLVFGPNSKNTCVTTASLDRIDSALPYVVGNVQWVHKYVNLMKMDLTHEEFLLWCGRVTKGPGREVKHRQRRGAVAQVDLPIRGAS